MLGIGSPHSSWILESSRTRKVKQKSCCESRPWFRLEALLILLKHLKDVTKKFHSRISSAISGSLSWLWSVVVAQAQSLRSNSRIPLHRQVYHEEAALKTDGTISHISSSTQHRNYSAYNANNCANLDLPPMIPRFLRLAWAPSETFYPFWKIKSWTTDSRLMLSIHSYSTIGHLPKVSLLILKYSRSGSTFFDTVHHTTFPSSTLQSSAIYTSAVTYSDPNTLQSSFLLLWYQISKMLWVATDSRTVTYESTLAILKSSETTDKCLDDLGPLDTTH